jgi:hypothetical protein
MSNEIDSRKNAPLPLLEGSEVNDERLAAVARALVGLVPMGSAVVELFELLRNEPNKQKRDAWLRALSARVNEHETKLHDVEGSYLSFVVDDNGAPNVDSIDSDRIVSSFTDHGANDFEINFAEVAESDKVVVSPISESPSIKVIKVGVGSVRFALPDVEAPAGRKIELHLRQLPPRK